MGSFQERNIIKSEILKQFENSWEILRISSVRIEKIKMEEFCKAIKKRLARISTLV